MNPKLARLTTAAWCLLALAGAFPMSQAAPPTDLQEMEASNDSAADSAMAKSILAPYRVSPTPPWEARTSKPVRA